MYIDLSSTFTSRAVNIVVIALLKQTQTNAFYSSWLDS